MSIYLGFKMPFASTGAMDKLSLPYKCRLPTVSNHQKITNRTPGNSLHSKRSIGRHVAALGGKNEMEVILHQENGVSCKLVRLSGDKNCSKLLVYLPGTDGTGQSIVSQLPTLEQDGWDVWTLYLPVEERSGWDELTARTAELVHSLATGWREGRGNQGGPSASGNNHHDDGAIRQSSTPPPLVTLVGESFGGCLALRVALFDPALVERLVLINPATCFNSSLNGLSALISGTNLLGLFPQQLYSVAQATLLPLLVDSQRVSREGKDLLRRMILMQSTVQSAPGNGRTTAAGNDRGQGGAAGAFSSVTADRFFSAQPVVPAPLPFSVPASAMYGPAAAANFRVGLLREGDLPLVQLKRISPPTVIISSARDRLLPSIEEGARLLRSIPNSVRIILPDSGHAALLEQDIDLSRLIRQGHAKGIQAQVARAEAAAAAASRLTSRDADSKGPENAVRRLTSSPLPPSASASSLPTSAPPAIAKPQLSALGYADSPSSWTEWAQRLAPWRDLVSPVVIGTENLPPEGSEDWARPMLFVGNHGKMGFYDTPLLMYELFVRGYRIRGLAHPGHWDGPFGSFFESFGAVKASPMAAFRLLKNNDKVLLFPGGAREVVKKRGEEYQLMWRETPDFVRLAAKCKALIVPFAAVGADDAYDVIMETDEQLEHPVMGPLLRGVLQRVGTGELKPAESIFPLTRLPVLGLPTPIPIPNLTRLYFKFGVPVDTAKVQLDIKDEAQCQALYDGIRETVNQDLSQLLELRSSDGERNVDARIRRTLSSLMGSASAAVASTISSDSDSEEPKS